MSRRPLNATAASLLGFLHHGPQSGWDLVATAAREIGGFWSLTRSQVYRELAALAAAGLIETDSVGARERRAYRLTDEGRHAFRSWVEQMPGQEQIRFPLLLTLAFARHLPADRVAAFVAAHRAVHTERLQGYLATRRQALADGARDVDLVTLDFGIRYETAVVEWFDHLPADLRAAGPGPQPGG